MVRIKLEKEGVDMKKAKAIMIQGTMSNAGKSLITAGLCRMFAQDGYRVAPFKSQNMALNSYITEEGLEMGRAQAVQAEAAGIKPTADMNPVLLKPTTDIGSQVIVNGVHQGNMSAREYFAYKKQLVPSIMEAYRRLEAEYDIIVIEGAGSPAEINLKREDIVNMGMARMADAPVLLVGDIDRGGVFAQLYGTVMLLEEEEKSRIKGMMINKFRGDKTILDPGTHMIEKLCHIPVVGVIPYMQVEIEDEDSLSGTLEHTYRAGGGLLDIVVIRLPRISNFTDFQVMSEIPQVSLRYVARLEELGNPDMVILPGTKNTIDDLLWMRRQGIEAAVMKLAAREVPILGICGGYQMLGHSLKDLHHLEGNAGHETVRGMELLPVTTVYEEEKTKTRVTGAFGEISGILKDWSGQEIEGYEIHMGRTEWLEPLLYDGEASPLSFLIEQQSGSKQVKADGVAYGNIYGTYIHGILDHPGIAKTMVQALLNKKGYHMEQVADFDYNRYKQQQFDQLADQLRQNLDMDQIRTMMGLDNGIHERRQT